MGITSLNFLIFLFLLIAGYYILPSKIRWILLLVASVVYIGLSGNMILLLYPVITIGVTWFCANRIETIREEANTGEEQRKCKVYLFLAVVFDVVVLFVLKYANMGIYTFNAIAGRTMSGTKNLEPLHFLIPMGLSFYTLSIVGYMFDVYYGVGKAEKNYLKLLLFGIYFPLLISGPIIRYRETGLLLTKEHHLEYKNLTYGAQRILWGFFKALIISERLAIVVNTIFNDSDTYYGAYVVIAAFGFTLQLYSNFSGSMDIVLGISQMLGVELPENFRQPFFSETIQEFWQRWHITLGGWLRDYIMYPILRTNAFSGLKDRLKTKYGKKKANHITTYLAMLILWFIAGLWHGGAWKYVWGVGLLQGIYIIVGEIIRNSRNTKKDSSEKVGRCLSVLRRLRTFVLISIAFVFFRADSLTQGFVLLGRIFKNWSLITGDAGRLGLDVADWIVLAGSLLTMFGVSILQQKANITERLAKTNIVLRWCILFAGLFAVIILGNYGPGYDAAEFIYQGF